MIEGATEFRTMAGESLKDFDDIGPTPDVSKNDRFADELREAGAGRSNFAAFLLGGIVIAGGMLAFLYYDTGNLATSRDDLTTGSIIRMDARMDTSKPAVAPNIAVPAKQGDVALSPGKP